MHGDWPSNGTGNGQQVTWKEEDVNGRYQIVIAAFGCSYDKAMPREQRLNEVSLSGFD